MVSNKQIVDPQLLSPYIPLEALRPETREQLAKKASLGDLAAGKVVFKIGDALTDAIFVVVGTVALEDEQGTCVKEVSGGTPGALHRLNPPLSRKLTARCLTAVRYLAVDAGLLDVLLTWDQSGTYAAGELSTQNNASDQDWMERLLQMRSFQMVPPSNLQAMFMHMEPLSVEPDQIIVRQEDAGDFFYVVMEGRCAVTREQAGHRPLRLAELESGSCFGEEALISDSKRNATVTMVTRGTLMRLSKENFRRFLNDPLTRRLPYAKAEQMVQAGNARWLDVRLPTEHQQQALPGSLNIPLNLLRARASRLDSKVSYVVCCDTGRRSSAGVFILTQKGFDAYLLDKGIPARKSA